MVGMRNKIQAEAREVFEEVLSMLRARAAKFRQMADEVGDRQNLETRNAYDIEAQNVYDAVEFLRESELGKRYGCT